MLNFSTNREEGHYNSPSFLLPVTIGLDTLLTSEPVVMWWRGEKPLLETVTSFTKIPELVLFACLKTAEMRLP
jgi:hypothetical protein